MEKEENGCPWKKYASILIVTEILQKKMICTQTLPAHKIDRKWKFKISEVDSCMRNNN